MIISGQYRFNSYDVYGQYKSILGEHLFSLGTTYKLPLSNIFIYHLDTKQF